MKQFIILLTILPSMALAQAGSEIFLFDVRVKNGQMILTNPVNATNHPGYDNQPSFDPNQPVVYYSSFNDEGRADIKSFNYETEKTNFITMTNEREYSPTVTPDGRYLSCIIQRDNDAQDLGKYPREGGEAITLIDNLIVGYHAWIDSDNLLLFVLGEPATLRWYNLATKTDKVLAENIGRSLHKIPGENAMSFVLKKGDGEWVISRLDVATQVITPIVNSLPGREDMTWTRNGSIIMSDGEKIFMLNTKKEKSWREIKVEASQAFQGITRLALGAGGKKMAIVVSE